MIHEMKDHIELGKTGEDLAVKHLESNDYQILERNWHWGKQEIDIIARQGNFIVIVEVKTRQSNFFAEPETSVTKSKQRILIGAANAYVRYKRLQGEVRFDIIALLIQPNGVHLNHIVDAFYATL